MYSVLLNNENYFTGSFAKVGSVENGVRVSELPPDVYGQKALCWKRVDESWEFDSEKYSVLLNLSNVEEIRAKREEAFKDIDKYQLPLVYAELTIEQQMQLRNYRNEWLNAPETGVLPDKLSWM